RVLLYNHGMKDVVQSAVGAEEQLSLRVVYPQRFKSMEDEQVAKLAAGFGCAGRFEAPVNDCLLSQSLRLLFSLQQMDADEILLQHIDCGKLVYRALDKRVPKEKVNSDGKDDDDRKSHYRVGYEQAREYVQLLHAVPLQVTRPAQQIKGQAG